MNRVSKSIRMLQVLFVVGVILSAIQICPAQIFGYGVAMYRPIISYAPTGIMADVEATVSADRRYVTLTVWGFQDVKLNNKITPENGMTTVTGNLPNLAPPNMLTGGYNGFGEYSSGGLNLEGRTGSVSFHLGSPYWGGCRRSYLPVWYGPTVVSYGQGDFARTYASSSVVQAADQEIAVPEPIPPSSAALDLVRAAMDGNVK